MKPARIILLLVAVVAGGLAAFLVTRGGPAPQQIVETQLVQEAKAQVLVASLPIGMGERLSADNLQWQEWPEGALRPEYVTSSALPDATTSMAGSVARFEFFPGEPIREAKLVRSDQGYLSAVLSEGKRGVSVGVTAASSAGGFVVPNDRVDVVVTEQTPDGPRSTIILTDVRVLAIGQRLGEMGASGGQEDPTKPTTTPVVFDSSTIATLELAPAQAETLINAATLGQLSLTLRSVVDFNKATAMERAATNQTVRLIRAGREQSITAGAIQPQPAVLDASANVEPVLPSLEPQELPQ